MPSAPRTFLESWKERIDALRNVPPLLGIVWKSGPGVVCGGIASRIFAALIPLSLLAVSKRILDGVQLHFSGQPLPPSFWYLVAAEFGLAVIGSLIGRASGYFDTGVVDTMVSQHRSGLRDHSRTLWLLWMFQRFLEREIGAPAKAVASV